MAEINNIANITQVLRQALRSQDLSVGMQDLQAINQQLRAYLLRLEELGQAIAGQIEAQVKLVENSNINVSEIGMRYWAMKELQKREGDLAEILKQGYIYIEAIRKAITGQETEYLVATKRYGTLVEGKATLTEILNSASLSIDTRASYDSMLKLRLTRQPEILKSDEADRMKIADSVAESSSVFSAVYNYFAASSGQVPKVNKGNAYETYRLILAERQGNNRLPPPITIDTIETAYAAVKGNTLPFYKGGDIGMVQVKYFGGSAPSLVTMKTIQEVLSKAIQLFDELITGSKPNNRIASGFAELFISKESQVSNLIEQTARNEGLEHINQLFGTNFQLMMRF